MKARRIVVSVCTPFGGPIKTKALWQREDDYRTPGELVEKVFMFVNPLNLDVTKVGEFKEDSYAHQWPNTWTFEHSLERGLA